MKHLKYVKIRNERGTIWNYVTQLMHSFHRDEQVFFGTETQTKRKVYIRDFEDEYVPYKPTTWPLVK